jgi:alpha-L-fucosidase
MYATRLLKRGAAGNVTPPHFDFRTPEFTVMKDIRAEKWETCRGMGRGFGFNREEQDSDYIQLPELIRLLVDIVSKNGNLLLNVGPKADGTIPEIQAERLRALGRWLAANGEAIYGTRPWERSDGKTSDGVDVRFTRKGDAVYAILLAKPGGSEVTIESLPVKEGATVTLLGQQGALKHRSENGNLIVTLPAGLPDAHAYTLKITGA